MAITDKGVKDLLKLTLEDMYGVGVWWTKDEPGVYHIRAGGKTAVVTWDEIKVIQSSAKGFVDLLKEKLGL